MVVNKKTLSDLFGVTDRTLTNWELKGMPVEDKTGRGISNGYDLADVIQWRLDSVARGFSSETPKERKDRLEGDLLQIKLDLEQSKWLDVETVEHGLHNLFASIKSALSASPRKLKIKLEKKYNIQLELDDLIDHVNETLVVMHDNALKLDEAEISA